MSEIHPSTFLSPEIHPSTILLPFVQFESVFTFHPFLLPSSAFVPIHVSAHHLFSLAEANIPFALPIPLLPLSDTSKVAPQHIRMTSFYPSQENLIFHYMLVQVMLPITSPSSLSTSANLSQVYTMSFKWI
jgi:hypothetical protein